MHKNILIRSEGSPPEVLHSFFFIFHWILDTRFVETLHCTAMRLVICNTYISILILRKRIITLCSSLPLNLNPPQRPLRSEIEANIAKNRPNWAATTRGL